MADETIQSDLPFSTEQRRVLDALLVMVIPPSDDGRMPGADEVGFVAYVAEAAPDVVPLIEAGLEAIDAAAKDDGQSFADMTDDARQGLIDRLQADQGQFFRLLTTQVMSCYYQHDRVLEGLGLEAKPPFPDGHEVEQGDLSLLEPVRKRGKIWRDV